MFRQSSPVMNWFQPAAAAIAVARQCSQQGLVRVWCCALRSSDRREAQLGASGQKGEGRCGVPAALRQVEMHAAGKITRRMARLKQGLEPDPGGGQLLILEKAVTLP